MINSKSGGINDSSDESGDEIKILPKRPEIKKQSKNGALWKEMLEEESLMENMKTFEVAKNLRKRKIDRGAESYESLINEEKAKDDSKSDDSNSAHCSKRKKFKLKHHKVDKRSKHLPDLETFENDLDGLVKNISEKLDEENLELIKKVVSAIGAEESINFYKKTQKIELNGGLLTVNKDRRRTSGGLFLFLVKTSNKISDEERKKIFD